MCGRSQPNQPVVGSRCIGGLQQALPGGAYRAFTFVEVLVAMAIAGLVVLGIMSFFLFAGRSFAAMVNYLDMDKRSQLTLDQFSQQVRQVRQLTAYSATHGVITSLTFEDYDGGALTFAYDAAGHKLTRSKGGQVRTLLPACSSLEFRIFQENVTPGTFDGITTATATNCKLVEVNWTCSKKLAGSLLNTEIMESAKVAIRQ
jgi:prepilin-type N-terminal cleavage/methylation domain-containing protein